MTLVVDIHAIQTLPPSLINRDDVGAPKTAAFGGVPRQRVSSQAWKRAMRKYYAEHVSTDEIGKRSKRLPEVIARKALEINPDLTEAELLEGLKRIFKAAKISLVAPDKKADEEAEEPSPYHTTSYLLFLSPAQIDRAAEAIATDGGTSIGKKEAETIFDTKHSVDQAAFGRMLADAPNFNVDAAVQVAHALSVHEAQPEFDYFTAVDDVVEDNEEIGAGMIGTIQLMSSTLYRYATINVEGLAENLGSKEHAVIATGHLIQAFIESLPTSEINTFANQTLPELVYVTVRDTRPVSLANAFETPVSSDGNKGRRIVAAERLATESQEISEQYGLEPTAAFVIGLGDLRTPFEGIATVTTLPELSGHIVKALQG